MHTYLVQLDDKASLAYEIRLVYNDEHQVSCKIIEFAGVYESEPGNTDYIIGITKAVHQQWSAGVIVLDFTNLQYSGDDSIILVLSLDEELGVSECHYPLAIALGQQSLTGMQRYFQNEGWYMDIDDYCASSLDEAIELAMSKQEGFVECLIEAAGM